MYFKNPKGWGLMQLSNKKFTHSGIRSAEGEGKEKGTLSTGNCTCFTGWGRFNKGEA